MVGDVPWVTTRADGQRSPLLLRGFISWWPTHQTPSTAWFVQPFQKGGQILPSDHSPA